MIFLENNILKLDLDLISSVIEKINDGIVIDDDSTKKYFEKFIENNFKEIKSIMKTEKLKNNVNNYLKKDFKINKKLINSFRDFLKNINNKKKIIFK